MKVTCQDSIYVLDETGVFHVEPALSLQRLRVDLVGMKTTADFRRASGRGANARDESFQTVLQCIFPLVPKVMDKKDSASTGPSSALALSITPPKGGILNLWSDVAQLGEPQDFTPFDRLDERPAKLLNSI
jgi:hypothetical protein